MKNKMPSQSAGQPTGTALTAASLFHQISRYAQALYARGNLARSDTFLLGFRGLYPALLTLIERSEATEERLEQLGSDSLRYKGCLAVAVISPAAVLPVQSGVMPGTWGLRLAIRFQSQAPIEAVLPVIRRHSGRREFGGLVLTVKRSDGALKLPAA